MDSLEFGDGGAPLQEKTINQVVEPLGGVPDFSDIEAEYEGAGIPEPEAENWDKHRTEKVPEEFVIDPETALFTTEIIGFMGDLACGIANRQPLSDVQKARIATRVLGVVKFYPRLFKMSGTPKQKSWAMLAKEIGVVGYAKAKEPPMHIYPDGSEAEPPESHAPQVANTGGFHKGSNSFGASS